MAGDKTYPRFTWEEYASFLEGLFVEISGYLKKNGLKIDVVVPIMRGGGIPGIYLAYKFWVLSIFPIYYHYDFRSEGKMKLRRLGSIKRYADLIPDKPVILLVEGNQCFGNTARAALSDIKTNIKDARILYAADLVDYGHRDVVRAEASFFGTFTNECETLTKEEARAKGIFPTTKLLPWEVEREEKETLETKQFDYADLGSYFGKSKVVKEIDLKELG